MIAEGQLVNRSVRPGTPPHPRMLNLHAISHEVNVTYARLKWLISINKFPAPLSSDWKNCPLWAETQMAEIRTVLRALGDIQ